MTPGPETRSWRLGLRREVLILLPVALLLLVVLSTFTLFSYRNAIHLLADERRAEAARVAASVASHLAGAVSPGRLLELAPGARGVALAAADGTLVTTAGELPPVDLLAPLTGHATGRPVGLGPREDLPDVVAGFAPLAGQETRRIVRVDLPAGVLAGQLRGLSVLSVVVLAINGALMLLVVLFTRHLLAPYETLLERAQQAGRQAGAGEDEVEFLLDTFGRALTALTRGERRAEDDIAALERTLAASLESGLLLLGREGEVLAVNAVGARLLAVDPPAPSTPLAEMLRDQPELNELLTTAIREGGDLRREECTVRGAGGSTLTLGLTAHPLRRDDGGTRGYLVLFADLTEARRQAEEGRLAESLAQLGELAGGVAHELRNSLATLRGYLTLIERRPDEDSIADFLSEIRHEADHLERVLEDFLAFARPGTARAREFSLTRLVLRASADPALAGVEVAVTQDPAGDVVLRGDPQLLERAIRNLLHNAAQAEKELGRQGPVAVAVRLLADGAEVAIEDRGPGLSPEIRERLFHPFATGRPGGVGLGLALARRIVVLHGGRIRLDDREGGGTRAVLFFPAELVVSEPDPQN